MFKLGLYYKDTYGNTFECIEVVGDRHAYLRCDELIDNENYPDEHHEGFTIMAAPYALKGVFKLYIDLEEELSKL